MRLIGVVGCIKELKESKAGEPVFEFSIQTSSKTKEVTHRVAAFNNLAINSQKYFGVGDQVIVRGELDYINWNDGVEDKEVAVIRAFSAFRLNQASTKKSMPTNTEFDQQTLPRPAKI